MTDYAIVDAILQERDNAVSLHSWDGWTLLEKVAIHANEAGEALREAVKLREGGGDIDRLKREVYQSMATGMRLLEELEEKT